MALRLVVGASLLAACAGGADQDADRPVVRIYGPYHGEEAALFTAGLEEWAETARIDVRYTGSADFVSDLQYQVVETLDPPDIAIVPQPGLVQEMFRDGHIVPVSNQVAEVFMRHYDDEPLELGRVDGTLVGFPYRANVKSFVWYRPEVLASLGLTRPETMDELESSVQQIQARGFTPWCLGIESQRATGWPATDWVEDLVVRMAGPDVYADWVSGDVPFSDQRIEDAFATFRSLVLEPGRVAGGISSVLSTNIEASDDPLFEDPPGCVLFKQASFALGWMPPDLELGPDGQIDFFVLPGQQAGDTPPIVVGADLAVAFSNRPEVDAVMAHLATPEAGRPWAEGGSYVSPRSSVDPASYNQPADQATTSLLLGADTLVFDASDAMPPEIGTTLFWTQITSWVSGRITYDQLAQTLDDARTD